MLDCCCTPPCPTRVYTTVQDCAGNKIAGKSVTLVCAANGYSESCTSTTTGDCFFDVTEGGTYTLTVDGLEKTLTIPPPTPPCLAWRFIYCLGSGFEQGGTVKAKIVGCALLPLAGVEVKFQTSIDTVYATTDADGVATACIGISVIAPNNLTISVETPPDRFVGTSGTATAYPCGTMRINRFNTFQLQPAEGYHCSCTDSYLPYYSGCNVPYKDTLNLSTPYGDVTMEYTDGVWIGSHTVDVPACGPYFPSCPGVEGYTITYKWTTASNIGAHCGLDIFGEVYDGTGHPCSGNGVAPFFYHYTGGNVAPIHTGGWCNQPTNITFQVCHGLSCGAPGYYCFCDSWDGDPDHCVMLTLTE